MLTPMRSANDNGTPPQLGGSRTQVHTESGTRATSNNSEPVGARHLSSVHDFAVRASRRRTSFDLQRRSDERAPPRPMSSSHAPVLSKP